MFIGHYLPHPFLKMLFIYSWETHTHTERHRQREKQASPGEPYVGLHHRTPGPWPEPKADAQPLSHPGTLFEVTLPFSLNSLQRHFTLSFLAQDLTQDCPTPEPHSVNFSRASAELYSSLNLQYPVRWTSIKHVFHKCLWNKVDELTQVTSKAFTILMTKSPPCRLVYL